MRRTVIKEMILNIKTCPFRLHHGEVWMQHLSNRIWLLQNYSGERPYGKDKRGGAPVFRAPPLIC